MFQLSFSEAEILKDISFKIKKGEKIAIVGENGAGKSTLVKLLTGLYEAKSGDIIVNRNNINTYVIKQLQTSAQEWLFKIIRCLPYLQLKIY